MYIVRGALALWNVTRKGTLWWQAFQWTQLWSFYGKQTGTLRASQQGVPWPPDHYWAAWDRSLEAQLNNPGPFTVAVFCWEGHLQWQSYAKRDSYSGSLMLRKMCHRQPQGSFWLCDA